MQIIGLIMLMVVVAYGFTDREMTQVSAFDMHALIVVLFGSMAAVITSSTAQTTVRTLSCLRELLPNRSS